jgi:hypothetical protein
MYLLRDIHESNFTMIKRSIMNTAIIGNLTGARIIAVVQ